MLFRSIKVVFCIVVLDPFHLLSSPWHVFLLWKFYKNSCYDGMAATLPVLVAAHAGAEVIARLLDRADAAGEPAGSSEADGSNGSDGRADAARDEGGR